MKIAQVFSTPYPPTEGIATYVQGLSKELIRRGHEVVLFTRGSKTRRWHDDALGADIVEIRAPKVNPFHVHFQEPAFRRYIRKNNMMDWAFHIHTPYPPTPPQGVPYLVTVHTPMVPDSASIRERNFASIAQKMQSRFLKRRESRIITNARAITAVSAQVALELRDYGVEPKQVVVIGNAIDTNRFKPVKNPSCDYFLFAGRLGPRKGLETLLEASAILKERGVSFKLKITGHGPLRPFVEKKIRDNKLSSQIELLGLVSRDALPGLYANALTVVIPSHYEGLPTVLLEAMASGASIVATDIPGISESVLQDDRIILVPPHDPIALANALVESTFITKRSDSIRAHAVSNYRWAKIVDLVLNIPGWLPHAR